MELESDKRWLSGQGHMLFFQRISVRVSAPRVAAAICGSSSIGSITILSTGDYSSNGKHFSHHYQLNITIHQ